MAEMDYSELSTALPPMILEKIASQIADEYVATHSQEILALIDPQAVATLAVANAGQEIAKVVERPERIKEIVKREVYQRGILGGIRRIS